jgi:hypothetical protein
MFKDRQTQTPDSLYRQIQQKLSELPALVSLQEFGLESPPSTLRFGRSKLQDIGLLN